MDNSAVLFPTQLSLKEKLQPWLVCFSAALFFFYEFIQMNMFNSISGDLMQAFSVSGVRLGNLSAMFLYADVLFLLPAGIILDRISVRKVILIAMGLCVIGTIAFSQATVFWVAASCHFIAGIGNSFCFLSCIILASRWFPPRRMALVTGLIVTFAMTGGMIAQTPLTLLVQEIGWRHSVFLNGILGICIIFINWLFIQDAPKGYQIHQQSKKAPFFQGIVTAAKNVHTWLYAVYTSLLNLPIMVLGALWGVLALTQLHHLTNEQASFITAMIFLGTIFGGPVTGWISDQISLRKLPMVIFGVLSLVVMLAIMYLRPLHFDQLVILFFLLGFFTSAQVISYPAIAESNPKTITGTAMGLASVIIMGGGAISQPLFGWLLSRNWNHLIIDHKAIYSDANIMFALGMLPIAFILGIIAVMFARETRCKSSY